MSYPDKNNEKHKYHYYLEVLIPYCKCHQPDSILKILIVHSDYDESLSSEECELLSNLIIEYKNNLEINLQNIDKYNKLTNSKDEYIEFIKKYAITYIFVRLFKVFHDDTNQLTEVLDFLNNKYNDDEIYEIFKNKINILEMFNNIVIDNERLLKTLTEFIDALDYCAATSQDLIFE